LGARIDGIDEVTGSNPVGSTNYSLLSTILDRGFILELVHPLANLKEKLMTRKSKSEKSQAIRPLGMYCGEVIVSDDFDAPLPPELLALFLGEPIPPDANSPDQPTVVKRRRVRSRKSRTT
jgi:hypothetical protein